MVVLGCFWILHPQGKRKKWTVCRVPDLHDDEGLQCYGLVYLQSREIRINSKQSSAKAWATYLHELGHVLVYLYGNPDGSASWGDEEMFCEHIEAVFGPATRAFPNGRLW